MANLGTAIALMAVDFEGAEDKGGNPYALHCLHVMNGMSHMGEDGMIVGVLHDWLEDIDDASLQTLHDMGFSPYVIDGIDAMTKRPGEDYETQFIPRCKQHPLARECKKVDIRHNSDVTRLKGLRQKDFDRLAKYSRAYYFLDSE